MTVRPIAGTRRRGYTEDEDRALEAELLADPKELAEHLMLIDLGRNDCGRVANTGSVQLTGKMIVERYSLVMHIVSKVIGELAEGMSAIDVLRATFPAGTVSGAPKIRAIEITDELEPVKRGVYFASGCFDVSVRPAMLARSAPHPLGAPRDARPMTSTGARPAGRLAADNAPQ